MSITNLNDIVYTAYLEGSLALSDRGEWYHEGTAFTNQKVIRLFHQSIRWIDSEQRYYVVIGNGRAEFSLGDTAFFVTELITNTDPWRVRLADDSVEELTTESLCTGSQGQIYCSVKGGHRARFSRTANQTLLHFVVSDDEIEIAGSKVRLPPVEELHFICPKKNV